MYSLVEPVGKQAIIHFDYFVIVGIIVLHILDISIIAFSAVFVKTCRREGVALYLQVLRRSPSTAYFFQDITEPTLT